LALKLEKRFHQEIYKNAITALNVDSGAEALAQL